MAKSSKAVLFEKLMEEMSVGLKSFDPNKKRKNISCSFGAMNVDLLFKRVKDNIGSRAKHYNEISEVLWDVSAFEEALTEYADSKDLLATAEKRTPIIPEEYKTLTLNVDQSHTGKDLRFFMTTPDEYVSAVSGTAYLKTVGMSEEQAISVARKVVPQYAPRNPKGLFEIKGVMNETLQAYNTYVPPIWKSVKGVETPEELPKLFKDLVWHLFPIEIEREYFFSWLYHSLFERAYVYLVLCGAPGTGKNRLKLVLRALHGHTNTTDGKKSTLVDRFNSQLSDSTLVWFDELRYNSEMENVMKEVQNDSISIERKGIDATRSTKIFASFVISNNKPRDNYLAFDARKFAPLLITNKRLEKSMDPSRIDKLTRKVEDRDKPDFDPIFIAKIAKWVRKNAKRDLFPNLEYRGPMFWRLAHTSMSRWQKQAAAIILETPKDNIGKLQYEKGKGFRWSVAEEVLSKKSGKRDLMTDYSTVMHFFEIFKDGLGQPVFKTTPIRGNAMGDFYVKVINKDAKILNEADVLMSIEEIKNGKGSEEDKKENANKKETSTLNSKRGSSGLQAKGKSRGTSSGTNSSRTYVKVKNLAGRSKRGEASDASGRSRDN